MDNEQNTDISLPIYHECYSIGDNTFGQQGDNTTHKHSTLSKMDKLPTDIHINDIITKAYGSTYIICNNNSKLIVFGYNNYGQLGIGNHKLHILITIWSQKCFVNDIANLICSFVRRLQDAYESNQLSPIATNKSIKLISYGIVSCHHFLLTQDNNLYGFGMNKYNQILNPKNNNNFVEIEYFSQNNINLKQIQCALKSSVFLSDLGNVYVCGNVSNYIKQVDIKPKITAVSSGKDHILLLSSLGNVFSFGGNISGQLGHSHSDSFCKQPLLISYFMNNSICIEQIQCGEKYSVVLDVNGKVYCFGLNTSFECGIWSYKLKCIHTPQTPKILERKRIVGIKCGYNHTIALDVVNQYYLWGLNDCNQCLVYDESKYVEIPTKYNKKQDFYNVNCKIINMYPGYKETKIVIQICDNYLF
eukprot:356878_1